VNSKATRSRPLEARIKTVPQEAVKRIAERASRAPSLFGNVLHQFFVDAR
jgi:hypothetical protein